MFDANTQNILSQLYKHVRQKKYGNLDIFRLIYSFKIAFFSEGHAKIYDMSGIKCKLFEKYMIYNKMTIISCVLS